MYCIKAHEGRERIEVRYYQNGFLPSCRPVDISGKEEGKRLVVPGYIFMLKPVPRAEKVPDAEWKVIEAVSDPRISRADFSRGKITDGPLKTIEDLISEISAYRVKVSAVLLGKLREFWLPVRGAEEIQTAPETENISTHETGGDNGNSGTDKGIGEEKSVAGKKTEFSEEQIAEMLSRAEEIGIHAAAKEFSVPWQTLAMIRRKKAGEKRTSSIGSPTEIPDSPAALKKENAVLRERISELEGVISRLKNAFRELMDL